MNKADRNRIVSLAVIFLSPSLFASSPPSSSVQILVETSIRTNHESPTLGAYKRSGNTPQDVFKKVLSDPSENVRASLCQILAAQKDEDLTLFEHEIEDHLPCSASLLARIQNYWNADTQQFQAEQESSTQSAFLNAPIKASPHLPGLSEFPLLNSMAKFGGPEYKPTEERSVSTAEGPSLVRGDLKDGEIAITLDDGPSGAYTPKILASLAARGVRVNFFSTGENTKHYPAISKQCANEGHIMGSHSWDHPLLTQLSLSDAESQIIRGRDEVASASGQTSHFFRFPYGGKSKALGEFLKKEGMASFLWNIDSLDWKIRNSSGTLKNVLDQLSIQKGGIVLFHDIQPHTMNVIPQFIDQIHRLGYKTVVFVPR